MEPRLGTVITLIGVVLALWWASGLPWGLFGGLVLLGTLLNWAADRWLRRRDDA